MTIENNAKGCLLGLACGDALGRPVEFKSAERIASQHGTVTEMLGHGTHGQPAGTITDDTEMALCIAESLVDRRGFDPADVAERFVDWLDSGPFDIGLMTRDSLTRLKRGSSWDEAGVDVWESRPEGSNAGNGSVMRCAPHAIAFRDFEEELAHVSRLSSAITHADPRCQWGCVILNRTLANLICDEPDPLKEALEQTQVAPDELRTVLTRVQKAVDGERDRTAFESRLSTTGYVVDSLQAGLYFGLSTDSVESAIVQAVNSGGDTDTVGAIAGAVAGARFGSTNVPDRWTAKIEESPRLERLAQELLTIRTKVSDAEYATVDDGCLVFNGRTIEGPAYVPVPGFQKMILDHRPHAAPHHTMDLNYHELTPATAAMLDWERRAYAVETGQCTAYASPQLELGENSVLSQPALVPVPQYPFVESFEELPEQDQQWIIRDGRAAADAFVRAYVAFAGIRYPITENETDAIGIQRTDPIAGATRRLVVSFDDAGEMLFGIGGSGSYESPAEIKDRFDIAAAETTIAGRPNAVNRATKIFSELVSEAAAILDYVTQLWSPHHHLESTDTNPDDQLAAIRDSAHTMVGELYVMYESLRRVAIRHPEIEYERWQAINAMAGGR